MMTEARPQVSLTQAARRFIENVVARSPRVAVFDCDGTLWPGDAGAEFFYWELERGLIPAPVAAWITARYKDYKEGRVSEEAICGEMVTIHEGLRESELFAAAEEFFKEKFADVLFPEMLELMQRLRDAGCELWAVSSTNEWVVRAGTRRFGIPDEHILAACVHCDAGLATATLHRVPTDEDKAVAIREYIPSPVDAAFGNSVHDTAMLELARDAFAVNPNQDLERLAVERGWPVYFPMGVTRRG